MRKQDSPINVREQENRVSPPLFLREPCTDDDAGSLRIKRNAKREAAKVRDSDNSGYMGVYRCVCNQSLHWIR